MEVFLVVVQWIRERVGVDAWHQHLGLFQQYMLLRTSTQILRIGTYEKRLSEILQSEPIRRAQWAICMFQERNVSSPAWKKVEFLESRFQWHGAYWRMLQDYCCNVLCGVRWQKAEPLGEALRVAWSSSIGEFRTIAITEPIELWYPYYLCVSCQSPYFPRIIVENPDNFKGLEFRWSRTYDQPDPAEALHDHRARYAHVLKSIETLSISKE